MFGVTTRLACFLLNSITKIFLLARQATGPDFVQVHTNDAFGDHAQIALRNTAYLVTIGLSSVFVAQFSR